MEETDIIASGILQALKRGVSRIKAMQSFLNAGYPRVLVEAAARKAESMYQKGGLPVFESTGSTAVGAQVQTQGREYQTFQSAQNMGIFQGQQPMPRQVMPYGAGQKQAAMQEIGVTYARKKKSGLMMWIIVILIVLVTLLVNGFFIWKFVLG